MWNAEDVEVAMKQALFRKGWHEELEKLLGEVPSDAPGRKRLGELADGTRTFEQAVRRQLNDVLEEVRARSLSAVSDYSVDITGRVRVRTTYDEFLLVHDVLSENGFMSTDRMRSGSLEVVRRVLGSVTLIPPTGPMTRLELACSRGRRQVRWTKPLRPTIADLRSLALPGPLWPVYWIWRPIRLVGRAFLGRSPQSAPYLSTPTGLVAEMLRLVSPERGETLIDVGCGDARVLVEAVRAFGVRGVGVERDERLAEAARSRVSAEQMTDRISIIEGDLNELDVSLADIVFVFLPVFIARPLVPAMMGRLRTGSRLIAHEQSEPSWDIEPSRSHLIASGDGGVTVAYVWEA